ncbi:MAG: ferredoxin [SAR324 cluster bacterium]|nr:ferredoxin [SAR324 cluster bacterium]
MMGRVAYVEKPDCTSCQACTDELPAVFEMDDDDLAQVHNPAGATEEEIQDSMDSCPGECILWKD